MKRENEAEPSPPERTRPTRLGTEGKVGGVGGNRNGCLGTEGGVRPSPLLPFPPLPLPWEPARVPPPWKEEFP